MGTFNCRNHFCGSGKPGTERCVLVLFCISFAVPFIHHKMLISELSNHIEISKCHVNFFFSYIFCIVLIWLLFSYSNNFVHIIYFIFYAVHAEQQSLMRTKQSSGEKNAHRCSRISNFVSFIYLYISTEKGERKCAVLCCVCVYR